ncbi:hypothetical protein LSUCC0031_09690 [Rhodobacterales bacterium LSUCC0031]|nr:hypothetical protein [Rhodobacterales bacterium LSUCC0031]
MTQDRQGSVTAQALQTPTPRRVRRWRMAALLVVGLFVMLPVMAAGVLWLRMGAGPVTLPAMLAAQITARIDAAMAANRVTIGRIQISRSHGATGVDLTIRELAMTDPDGTIRAAFPALVVNLSGEALLQGDVAPVKVDLQGAGLRLARDVAGQIDLAFMAGGTAREISLGDSLARLDRMFASPLFRRLEVVNGRGLELVMADAMTGQTLRVRDARMRLMWVDGELSLQLGGALEGSRDATIDIALARRAQSGATDMVFAFDGLAARDIATIGPALAWVDVLRAPISGRVAGQVSDDGALGDLRVALDIGAGEVRPTPAAQPIAFDALQVALSYDARRDRLVFDRFDLAAPLLRFQGRGHADLLSEVSGYTGQFTLSDITIAAVDGITGPLVLAQAEIDLRLALAPDLLVEIGQVVIAHEGHILRGSGHVGARQDGLDIALDLALPEAESAAVLAYWPPAHAPVTRDWLAANVVSGRLSDITFALRATPSQPMQSALGLSFADADMRVLPHMPPIRGAAGALSLVDAHMALRLDAGQMTAPGGGAVSLAGSVMQIADTRQIGPAAQIDLAVNGALGDVLTLLQAPPVGLMAAGAMTPARLGEGQVAATAHIATRLIGQEGRAQPRVSFQGQVTDMLATALVPGRRLTAERLDVTLDDGKLRVAGAAQLDGVPLTGVWSRDLDPNAPRLSQVTADTKLSRGALAALGVTLPEWMWRGETMAAVTLDLPDDAPPMLRITSDLAGADLALPPLGWRQGREGRGQFVTEIQLGSAPAVTTLTLSVDGLDLAGRVALAADGAFRRLSADRFRIGSWLDVTGALSMQGGAQLPGIEITGGTLDLRGAPQSAPAGPRVSGGPITATLDRLQVTEGIAISPLIADLTTQGGLSGQFRGRVNGEAPVTGTLVSVAEGPAVRLSADDGGAVLRAAGVFQSARGGEMELILAATGTQGSYDGLLRIDGPRLRNAPVMAELLNVISVVGLIEQLSAEGIGMGNVEARFRVTPTQLILDEGVALGPSLGLSLDGTYDLRSKELDMSGVISPLNAVNGLFGAILGTRREGLFGFAYNLTGPAENPQVTVNPLSILTPGVFREIFRSPPPN